MRRINIAVPDEVKDWYQAEAKSNGVSMTALMSIVLTNHYKSNVNMAVMKQLADMSNDADVRAQGTEMFEFMKSPEFKTMLDAIKKQE